MFKYRHILISGGSGKRLWPLSRENYPKPYIYIDNNESLFQQTIKRHENCSDHIIITSENLFYQSKHQLNQINHTHQTEYILESVGRNTAPAILLAALHSKEDDFLVVTPADHQIRNNENYQADIQNALILAEKTKGIVLIGIQPTSPSTEFGYIKCNGTTVESFKEKPCLETAKLFISDSSYFWNSGIFCFQVKTILKAFNDIQPDLTKSITNAFHNRNELNIVNLLDIPSLQFDKGILEKFNNIHMIHNSFEWNDIGCFDQIESICSQNENEVSINSSNTFSLSTAGKTVAFHDVDDIYVIESNDSILVGKKGQSKEVSKIVESLQNTNQQILKHSNMVYRPWGYYNVLFESATYKVKQIIVYPNHRLSLQKHKHRSEHWTCVIGTVHVINGAENIVLQPNESIYIEKESIHRIENKGPGNAEIIEVQCGNYLGEDDITRLESDY